MQASKPGLTGKQYLLRWKYRLDPDTCTPRKIYHLPHHNIHHYHSYIRVYWPEIVKKNIFLSEPEFKISLQRRICFRLIVYCTCILSLSCNLHSQTIYCWHGWDDNTCLRVRNNSIGAWSNFLDWSLLCYCIVLSFVDIDECSSATLARTLSISGLKSRVMKLTFLN